MKVENIINIIVTQEAKFTGIKHISTIEQFFKLISPELIHKIEELKKTFENMSLEALDWEGYEKMKQMKKPKIEISIGEGFKFRIKDQLTKMLQNEIIAFIEDNRLIKSKRKSS